MYKRTRKSKFNRRFKVKKLVIAFLFSLVFVGCSNALQKESTPNPGTAALTEIDMRNASPDSSSEILDK